MMAISLALIAHSKYTSVIAMNTTVSLSVTLATQNLYANIQADSRNDRQGDSSLPIILGKENHGQYQ